jgi:hypothetical protein
MLARPESDGQLGEAREAAHQKTAAPALDGQLNDHNREGIINILDGWLGDQLDDQLREGSEDPIIKYADNLLATELRWFVAEEEKNRIQQHKRLEAEERARVTASDAAPAHKDKLTAEDSDELFGMVFDGERHDTTEDGEIEHGLAAWRELQLDCLGLNYQSMTAAAEEETAAAEEETASAKEPQPRAVSERRKSLTKRRHSSSLAADRWRSVHAHLKSNSHMDINEAPRGVG